MVGIRAILIFLLVVFFGSCQEKRDDLEFNRKVLSEILPDVVDIFCVDKRIFSNPPPKVGEIVYDGKGNYIETDSTKATQIEIKRLEDWKKYIKQIQQDTSKIIIVFDPLISPYVQEFKIIENADDPDSS